jgi:hypothetical protein
LRSRGSRSAFTLAALAAGLALVLSVAGPGSLALAAGADGLAPDSGGGGAAPPFVARQDAAPLRSALPANRRSADQPATLAAVLPDAIALAAPGSALAGAFRPAAGAPSRLSDLTRTSRGPPAR